MQFNRSEKEKVLNWKVAQDRAESTKMYWVSLTGIGIELDCKKNSAQSV